MDSKGHPSAKREPRNILMLKGVSAGVGDLLRGSAAWSALKERFPASRLHLWFLTRDPGAPSEMLIGRHHLLASFQVSDKRTSKFDGWGRMLSEARAVAKRIRPDMIIDFDTHGIRTCLLTLWLKLWTGARTYGVAEVPGRGLFYNRAAPSRRAYGRRLRLRMPLEYVELDFVALAGLGIERRGRPIVLQETDEAMAFHARLSRELAALQQGTIRPVLGVNIGCGPPTVGKRPDLEQLASLVRELQQRYGFALVLTGASNEAEFNRDFLSRLRPTGPVVDLAGRTTILELAGAISACRLFISSDSGPYHMAVGLRVPTLALFNWDNWRHYHHHEWIECLVFKDPAAVAEGLKRAERLMQVRAPLDQLAETALPPEPAAEARMAAS